MTIPTRSTAPAEIADQVWEVLDTEAALLDAREWLSWLDLFTEVCRYWVPLDPDARDAELGLNLILDNRVRMEDRVGRLANKDAHAASLGTRTARVCGRPVVTTGDDGAARATRPFVLQSFDADGSRSYAGRYEYVLELGGNRPQIRTKVVRLLQAESPHPAMTWIL